MPRRPRVKSESGIYHIMLRGANKQVIFHDDADRVKFLETVSKYKIKSGLEVYAWCLMDNHVHLLIKEGNEDISVTMKRIGVSFVWHYNVKYQTTGHLFQDRFRSENVESNRYLLIVTRYIHQNPVKAGMVNMADDWKWSSYLGYYGQRTFPRDLLDYDYILNIISKNTDIAKMKFKTFHEILNNDECLDDCVNERRRLTDREAREKIEHILEGVEIAQVKSLSKVKRNEIISKVKGIDGVSQRQAARILGISPNLIFKA